MRANCWAKRILADEPTGNLVQVVDESNGEIVYTLRIKGHTFRPKVCATDAAKNACGSGDGRAS
jgi:aspartate 1-decarboxylase